MAASTLKQQTTLTAAARLARLRYAQKSPLPIGVLLALLLTGSAGCGTTNYVAAHEPDLKSSEGPRQATFTVIPVNRYLYQASFASTVEAAFLRSGVQVVAPPSVVDVVEQKSLEDAQMESRGADSEARAAKTKVTESYQRYEDLDSDYFVKTLADSHQVKIYETRTRQLLAVVRLSKGQRDSSIARELHKVLVSLDIPVGDEPKSSGPKRKYGKRRR